MWISPEIWQNRLRWSNHPKDIHIKITVEAMEVSMASLFSRFPKNERLYLSKIYYACIIFFNL